MGGWNSGGHNKENDCVEKRQNGRVDSVAFSNHIKYDKYAMYKDRIDVPVGYTHIRYFPQTRNAYLYENGKYKYLELARVKNIDEYSQRVYFICPYCWNRVRYLYRNRNGQHMCRKCSKLNYKCQQVNGMDKLRLKMERIVEKKLGYTAWGQDYDQVVDIRIIKKPPYMRWNKYSELLQEFRKLQVEYYKEFQKASFSLLWRYF